MSFQKENDELLTSLFERTFFSAWSPENRNNQQYANFQGLEIILNYDCNLGCQYCYVNRYGGKIPTSSNLPCLYDPETYENEDKLLQNLDVLLNWLVENDYRPKIELFSGEPLVQQVAYKAIDMIIEKLSGSGGAIIIPTNYTFILSDSLVEKVEKLIEKSFEHNVPVFLSASFDGKIIEQNRPFRYNIKNLEIDQGIAKWTYHGYPDPRDDVYYDKAFAFSKKWDYGLHPMVYSNTVHLWRDNFLWFQRMFEKHGISFWNLYLLEVRNPEWTIKQIKDFGKFIEFLIKWSWNRVGGNFDAYINFLFQGKGFNILNSGVSTIGRGLGCGYQSNFYVRLGDMGIVSCHRTSYDPFVFGHFEVENGRIEGIRAKNVEYAVSSISLNSEYFPYCEQCVIRNLCPKGCLGAQMETTGDPFTPIPSMCMMEHEKIAAMIRTYKQLNIFQGVLDKISREKAAALECVDSLVKNGK